MKNAWRYTPTTLLALLALLVLLLGAGRGDQVSDLQLAVGRHQQDLLHWHVTHFMDKWVHLALRPIIGKPTPEERAGAIDEFFGLGTEARRLRTDLTRALASPADAPAPAGEVQAALDAVEARRAELAPVVQEALEAAISQALEEMGIIDRIGPIRWPPVNFTFEPGALLLVRSPRDSITRLSDVLIRSDSSLLEQVAIEDAVEAGGETAALVVRIGGLATYPAQVTPDASLHATLFVASHEWLHHWMFFRPLGKRWWDGGELTVINETVADLVGEEIGDRAYELLTGRRIEREPWRPPALRPREEPPPGVFDYTREMRSTRTHLEHLLGAGRVEEAEAYLEERRQEFVAQGWNIRKLNTAWFAFHGTYAGSAGSISPIEDQIRTIREASGSLAAFLERVADITRPGQLEAMARAAGWTPFVPDEPHA